MKLLKSKSQLQKKKIFDLQKLVTIKDTPPLQELLNGEEMNEPIEVIKHVISNTPRKGAAGSDYIEKEFSVHKGNQRVSAAKQLGYTHIEGIIINE